MFSRSSSVRHTEPGEPATGETLPSGAEGRKKKKKKDLTELSSVAPQIPGRPVTLSVVGVGVTCLPSRVSVLVLFVSFLQTSGWKCPGRSGSVPSSTVGRRTPLPLP